VAVSERPVALWRPKSSCRCGGTAGGARPGLILPGSMPTSVLPSRLCGGVSGRSRSRRGARSLLLNLLAPLRTTSIARRRGVSTLAPVSVGSPGQFPSPPVMPADAWVGYAERHQENRPRAGLLCELEVKRACPIPAGSRDLSATYRLIPYHGIVLGFGLLTYGNRASRPERRRPRRCPFIVQHSPEIRACRQRDARPTAPTTARGSTGRSLAARKDRRVAFAPAAAYSTKDSDSSPIAEGQLSHCPQNRWRIDPCLESSWSC
jgi:hypothetical protein